MIHFTNDDGPGVKVAYERTPNDFVSLGRIINREGRWTFKSIRDGISTDDGLLHLPLKLVMRDDLGEVKTLICRQPGILPVMQEHAPDFDHPHGEEWRNGEPDGFGSWAWL